MDLAVTAKDRLKRMVTEDTFLLGKVRTEWPNSCGELNFLINFIWTSETCPFVDFYISMFLLINTTVNETALLWIFLQSPPDWFSCGSKEFIAEFLERSRGLEKQMWFLAGLGLCVEITVGLCPALLQHCWHFHSYGQYGLCNRGTISWKFHLSDPYQHCIISDGCTGWMNCNIYIKSCSFLNFLT